MHTPEHPQNNPHDETPGRHRAEGGAEYFDENPLLNQEELQIAEKSGIGKKILRRVGGTAAAAALGVGAVIGVSKIDANDNIVAEQSTQQIQPEAADEEPTLFEREHDVPAEVYGDVERAVENDTCDTRVETYEVTDIYSRVFTDMEMPKGAEALGKEIDLAISRVEANRANVEFVSLPDGFNELKTDTEKGKPKLPYSQYKQVVSDYLSEYGVEFHDSLDTLVEIDEDTLYHLADGSKSLNVDELETSESARMQMVQLIESLSKLPKELASGLERVLIADVHNPYIVGKAFYESNIMLLDAEKGKVKADGGIVTDTVVVGHEVVGHLQHDEICSVLISGYVVDSSFEELNRAFKYGPKKEAKLNMNEPVKGEYVALRSGMEGMAVVVDPYGATDVAEDAAQILGEELVNPSPDLFLQKANSIIIYEKLAYMLARIEQKNPDISELMISQMQLAKLMAEAEQQMHRQFDDKENAILERVYDQEGGDPADDPEYMELQEKKAPYDKFIEDGWTTLGY